MTIVTKREFLRNLFLWASQGLFVTQARASISIQAEFKPTTTQLISEMLSPLNGLVDIESIGERYLLSFPSEADPDFLAEEIFGIVRLPVASSIKARAKRKIREEFDQEKFLVFEGWVLSRTEAQLCALAVVLEEIKNVR